LFSSGLAGKYRLTEQSLRTTSFLTHANAIFSSSGHSQNSRVSNVEVCRRKTEEISSSISSSWSRGRSVSIVSDYGLDDRASIPGKTQRIFFF
jgi:hypothetical protein